MKAAKLIETDDGLYMVKPCDVDEMDLQDAVPAESIEEAMMMLPQMLDEPASYEEEEAPAPMMEGEDEFVSGFKQGRGYEI